MTWLRDRWTKHPLHSAAVVAVLGAACLYVSIGVLPRRELTAAEIADDESSLTGRAVLLLVPGVIALVVALLRLDHWRQLNRWSDADRRRTRISKLSESLAHALDDISAIQHEVQRGTELLARLEAETETKAQLARLSDAESAAVRDLVQGAVRTETNRGVWLSIVIAFVFYILGLVSARVLGF